MNLPVGFSRAFFLPSEPKVGDVEYRNLDGIAIIVSVSPAGNFREQHVRMTLQELMGKGVEVTTLDKSRHATAVAEKDDEFGRARQYFVVVGPKCLLIKAQADSEKQMASFRRVLDQAIGSLRAAI